MRQSRGEAIDERFEAIDKRFGAIDERFGAIDERLDRIEARLDKHEERFLRIEGQLFEMQKEFTVVNAGIARLEGLMEGIISGGLVRTPLAQVRGQQAEAAAE